MALELLALAPWLVVGVYAVWLIASGRRFLGLPIGVRDGWPLRLFGLFDALGAGYFIYRLIDGHIQMDGMLFAYASLAALVLVALSRRRKAKNASP